MTVALSSPFLSPLRLTDVTWAQLESRETAFQGMDDVRPSYLAGNLKIMTLRPENGDLKSTFSLLLDNYLHTQKNHFDKWGSANLGSQLKGVRKRPDKSYNTPTKKSIDDLAIEVIIYNESIDILIIYQCLQVPKFWLWQGEDLTSYSLTIAVCQEQYPSSWLPHLDIHRSTYCVEQRGQYNAITKFSKSLVKTEYPP